MGGVPGRRRRASTKKDLYCSMVSTSSGPPRFGGRQLGMEAFDHHVEIGQHDEEQRPEGDEQDEGDAQHRAVALEEALVGGIVGRLLSRACAISQKMAMTTSGMRKTRKRLLTGHLPFRQHDAHVRIVVDRGRLALLRESCAPPWRPTVTVMSFLAAPLRKTWVTLPSKATDMVSDVSVASAAPLPSLKRFRPHEEDGLVAGLQPLGIAAAQQADARSRPRRQSLSACDDRCRRRDCSRPRRRRRRPCPDGHRRSCRRRPAGSRHRSSPRCGPTWSAPRPGHG